MIRAFLSVIEEDLRSEFVIPEIVRTIRHLALTKQSGRR